MFHAMDTETLGLDLCDEIWVKIMTPMKNIVSSEQNILKFSNHQICEVPIAQSLLMIHLLYINVTEI